MKLIIQIPCLNEEHTLPQTLADLPRHMDGVDAVETLVIDDGSTDRTVDVARQHGVDHILRLTNTKGLAKAFYYGMNHALKLGADLIVNTDADNQYHGGDIPRLIQPILEGKADIVIGDRRVETIRHFSPFKVFLQKFGSWVVRQLSGTQVPDATSGFRAYSREAALQMNVVSDFTYTVETIISAGKKNLAISHIPVRTNPKLRESRLFPNIKTYLQRTLVTIIKVYSMYKPLKVFTLVGSISFFTGFAIGVRFLFYYFQGQGQGHVQSLILSAILLIVGFQIVMMGIAAELIAVNRQLLEDIQVRVKKLELDSRE
ncbi:MAG: glycosyltransferase [Nitrospinaceae bacterium]|nr:glycosyltransferase family 2 protein [Nitrospinaceae bacterium]NIR56729.1 glycosyltransferase family 2 protein [Nitrospinaceae bacterium]NIS87178.1 glycosyltransferase family 2 protein [Nitrospinaceae bacterium]NIT84047.1 glycosyltransferase family 2 protein [Nitrospinaceae bacterium]NIU46230.1 glycosyltransferase family 2 protein [Nitrospinaceae bacterium]